ncbi:uncharacterized protein LOC134714854 [Mytilus trossulus]|uniref:uncharacterized protein LOC134714854 n=1 Tax=Mytilus trossulus TaxID=6551 RepID=UPI00300436CE
MTDILEKRFPAADTVVLSKGDRCKLVVHLFGATVLSWENRGKEILFLSENAVFNNKKAIRGGIPIVFPCFGPWDKGPQHGFARIKRWQVESPPKEEDGNIVCCLSLSDDEETRQMWDYQFKLLYTIQLGVSSLTLKLTIQNTGNKEFDFTTLMHTYFRTGDISHASISGLEQLTYIDKVADGKEEVEKREFVDIPENYDRVYKNCPSEIIVKGVTVKSGDVLIKTQNFPDIVVWNPWADKAKAMADFGDDEYKTMLCVEAGYVSKPVTIGPGSDLHFSQTLSML